MRYRNCANQDDRTMTIFQSDRCTSDRQADAAPPVGCRISLERIILMSVVSMGIYWLYWMYRTWMQFRDHTGAIAYPTAIAGENGAPVMWWYHARNGSVAYPAWHALTQLVPVYGFFRFHAHVRAFKTLMRQRGVPDTLNLDALVIIVVITTIVNLVAGGLSSSASVNLAARLAAFVIQLAAIAVGIGVLCHIQSNLTRYWANVDRRLTQSARFGKGEIVCIVLGILAWLGSIAGIIWPT